MPASQSIRCQLIIQHRPIDEKSDVEIEPAHERKQTFSVNLEKCGQEVSRLSLQVLQIRTHQRNRRQVGDRRDHVVRPSGADKHGGPSRGSRYRNRGSMRQIYNILFSHCISASGGRLLNREISTIVSVGFTISTIVLVTLRYLVGYTRHCSSGSTFILGRDIIKINISGEIFELLAR